MSLKNLELPDFVLAELYRSVLVEGKETVSPLESEQPLSAGGIKFLGSNSKKVVIVVNNPTQVFLSEGDLAFLTRILSACNLNLGDIALINAATSPVDGDSIHAQLHPSAMILLGIDPGELSLPFNFPSFKIQPHGGCNYLHAPAVEELNQITSEAKTLKGQLWLCLKQLFNV